MISYAPLHETLKKKNMSLNMLGEKYKIGNQIIQNIRKNKSITLFTLNRICTILDCSVEEVIIYKKTPEDEIFLHY